MYKNINTKLALIIINLLSFNALSASFDGASFSRDCVTQAGDQFTYEYDKNTKMIKTDGIPAASGAGYKLLVDHMEFESNLYSINTSFKNMGQVYHLTILGVGDDHWDKPHNAIKEFIANSAHINHGRLVSISRTRFFCK
jgi:hypothetical protein